MACARNESYLNCFYYPFSPFLLQLRPRTAAQPCNTEFTPPLLGPLCQIFKEVLIVKESRLFSDQEKGEGSVHWLNKST